MEERNTNTALVLFAAGAAAGATLTYAARRARSRLRKPLTQSMTVRAPRERVERFVETRESMLQALESKRLFDNVERLELRDAPEGRGTEMHLTMRGVGKYAMKDVLRRAKSILESGETPSGRRYE